MNATDSAGETAFTNVDALGFVFELLDRGPELLDEVANQKGRLSAADLKRLLAAGETVAAASGHVSPGGIGCTLIEEWLFESKFTLPEGLCAQYADRVGKILGSASGAARSGLPGDTIGDLLSRLRKPARRVKHKVPKPDRKSFRELLKSINASAGEVDPGVTFDRRGYAQVYLYYVTANAACKLANYRKVRGLELPLNDKNDPRQLTAALPILLRAWGSTLEYLLIEDVPHLSDPPNPTRFKALTNCSTELAHLPGLESFITNYLYFDDRLLRSVAQNPRLSNIEIKKADVTRDAIGILSTCRNLEAISIIRCPEFPPKYREELVARCPQAEIIEVV